MSERDAVDAALGLKPPSSRKSKWDDDGGSAASAPPSLPPGRPMPMANLMGIAGMGNGLTTGGISTTAKPGDWNCPGCGDLQFARNQKCRRCGAPNPSAAASEARGDWNCPQCGDLQFARNVGCRRCGTPNPNPRSGATKPGDVILGGKGFVLQDRPGDWNCPACGDHVFARHVNCRRCGTPNPNPVPVPQKGGKGGFMPGAAGHPGGACTVCGKLGHAEANCWHRSGAAPCGLCGKPGHPTEACWHRPGGTPGVIQVPGAPGAPPAPPPPGTFPPGVSPPDSVKRAAEGVEQSILANASKMLERQEEDNEPTIGSMAASAPVHSQPPQDSANTTPTPAPVMLQIVPPAQKRPRVGVGEVRFVEASCAQMSVQLLNGTVFSESVLNVMMDQRDHELRTIIVGGFGACDGNQLKELFTTIGPVADALVKSGSRM